MCVTHNIKSHSEGSVHSGLCPRHHSLWYVSTKQIDLPAIQSVWLLCVHKTPLKFTESLLWILAGFGSRPDFIFLSCSFSPH